MSFSITQSPYRSEFASQLRKDREAVKKDGVALSLEINPSILIVGLGLVAVLLGMIYLMQFNKVATKGYELKKLEMSRQELVNESDVRNLYLAKVKSMPAILDSDRLEPMRKASNMTFVYGEAVLASK